MNLSDHGVNSPITDRLKMLLEYSDQIPREAMKPVKSISLTWKRVGISTIPEIHIEMKD